jgi:hypothetical protein
LIEWKVTAGIWAFGLLILTIMLKLISTVFTGKLVSAAGDLEQG